jgi:hypothetical protein
MTALTLTDQRPCALNFLKQETEYRKYGTTFYHTDTNSDHVLHLPIVGLLITKHPSWDYYVKKHFWLDQIAENPDMTEPTECLTAALVLAPRLTKNQLDYIDWFTQSQFTRVWSEETNSFVLFRKVMYENYTYSAPREVRAHAQIRSTCGRPYVTAHFHEEQGDPARVWVTQDAVDVAITVGYAISRAIGKSDYTIYIHPCGARNIEGFDINRAAVRNMVTAWNQLNAGPEEGEQENVADASRFSTFDTHEAVRILRPVSRDMDLPIRADADVSKNTLDRQSVTGLCRSIKAITKRQKEKMEMPKAAGRLINFGIDEEKAPDTALVPRDFMDGFSYDRGTSYDNTIGDLMVIGLTKSLTPIRFQPVTTEWVVDRNLTSDILSIEHSAMWTRELRTSWLSPESRVYVHKSATHFRFLFAVKVNAVLPIRLSSMTKFPVFICFGHNVPVAGINTDFRTTWRGAHPDLIAAINAVPGLPIALVSALNEAGAQMKKISGDADTFWGLFNAERPCDGHVIAFTGWGREEIERLDDEVGMTRDEDQRSMYYRTWKDKYGFGGSNIDYRRDGLWSVHKIRARGYRGRGVPYPRVLDYAKRCFANVGKNLIVTAAPRTEGSNLKLQPVARHLDIDNETDIRKNDYRLNRTVNLF